MGDRKSPSPPDARTEETIPIVVPLGRSYP